MIVLFRILFSLAFGLFGLYLLRVVIALWKVKRDYAERGVVAEGEITGFEERRYSGKYSGEPMFAPVVQWTGPSGAPMEFTSSSATRPNPYTIGQRIAVRYLPENPASAELDGVAQGWFAIIALTIAIVVCFTVASLPFILPPPAPR